jgi:hypothetical protein
MAAVGRLMRRGYGQSLNGPPPKVRDYPRG